MKYIYTLLFALSITAINPWGFLRGEIWTGPKVFLVLLISLTNLLILWKEREFVKFDKHEKISFLLWQVFLGIGLLSTLQSPFPLRSLFGQEQMGDGWLYWLIIATFTLSNTLVLKLYPNLFRCQLNGLLIGGIILAISIYPQVIDWKIDYTVTMGQVIKENILASTIFQNQQPIGLYSHRGHAAFVLAAISVLFLVSWQEKWLGAVPTTMALIVMIPALVLTQTRAGVLALLGASVYLLGRRYYKLLITAFLGGLLIVLLLGSQRQIDNLPGIKQMTSDRIYLWELSLKGISIRPLLGWGMNGFGIAYPFVFSEREKPQVVNLGDLSFDYIGKNGQVRSRIIPTYKVHNLILDMTLSVGVLGMLSYTALFGFYWWRGMLTPSRERSVPSGVRIATVIICYFIFTFTWFECAQFTHLVWWALSLWRASHFPFGSQSAQYQ
ncbi:O-antigen ligase family protein [Aerosakkonemataceae cyanobacterium BLCC-F50]|uniref:O-antigen ligase family protein n=1 Tax=Floridaenema flaviceps BLCC-F50 TaxID=3153642 RepID=A0ABV4Y2X2_9CYAN